MSISAVTVVGANGNLGGPMLHALLAAGCFHVSVLRRATSTSVAEGEADGRVAALRVPAWTEDALAQALAGQDAVVVCFPLRDVEQHLALARAAAAAGVRRYIPADFGSVDARSARARALVPLFEKKEHVRHTLLALAAAHPGRFAFTSLVGGHFFDWGLRGGFLHIDLAARVTDVVLVHTHAYTDGGDAAAGAGDSAPQPPPRSSLTTLARYGEAVARVLQRGADDAATANKVLFVQSVCVSQDALQQAVERATAGDGATPWTVVRRDTAAYIRERKAAADAGDAAAIEDLVFALGVIEGDWTTKGDDFAMSLLGFQDEDLDGLVTQVVGASKQE